MRKYGPRYSVYTCMGFCDATTALLKGSMGFRIEPKIMMLQRKCSEKTECYLCLGCLQKQGWHGNKSSVTAERLGLADEITTIEVAADLLISTLATLVS